MTRTIIWRQRRKKEIRQKMETAVAYIIFLIMMTVGVYCMCAKAQMEIADAVTLTPEEMIGGEIYKVEATAYCYTGNLTASGHPTTEGLTVAGAKEWLGCSCVLYDENMEFIGFYDFQDTGYGKDGDIQRGETIDIYFESREDAIQWGRRNVYIQIIPSKG